MRPRTLWILLSLVVGLAAFVWFVERDLPGSDERAERAKRVFDVELDEISRISWARGEERVELSRSGAGEAPTWRLEAPFYVASGEAPMSSGCWIFSPVSRRSAPSSPACRPISVSIRRGRR